MNPYIAYNLGTSDTGCALFSNKDVHVYFMVLLYEKILTMLLRFYSTGSEKCAPDFYGASE